MLTRTLFLAVMLLCTSAFVRSGVGAQDNLPAIYYYSSQEEAFIVEGVDGSEREILAHYKMPDGHTNIEGPGWSASGKWFAWTSRPQVGSSHYNMTVYLQDEARQQYSLSFESHQLVDLLRWSPTSDLLLLLVYDTEDVLTPTVKVYDPVSGTYLLSYGAPEIPQYPPQQVEWSPNGRFILVSHNSALQLISLNSDAGITTLPRRTSECVECNLATLPHWLSDEHLAYLSSESNDLVVAAVDGNETNSIQVPEGEIHYLDWSPDNRYALLYVRPAEDDDFHLWLVSINNHTTRLIAEDVWFTNNYSLPFSDTLWSSDSRHAAFISGSRQVQVLSVEGDIAEVSPEESGEVRLGSRIEWAAAETMLFSWYVPALYRFELYQYDVSKNETLSTSSRLRADPNGVNFFSVHEGTFFLDGSLVNLETLQATNLVPLRDSILDARRTDAVQWHPSGDWLFLLSQYNGLYWVKLASITGTVSPEIALCPLYSESCFGWMPDR